MSCATRHQSKVVAVVGGATMLGGVAVGGASIALARSSDGENEAFRTGFGGLVAAGVIIGIGAALGIGGIVGYVTLPPDAPSR